LDWRANAGLRGLTKLHISFDTGVPRPTAVVEANGAGGVQEASS